MADEDGVHRAMKAWLQAAEADRPWLRRAKWAVQTRRSDGEAGPWGTGDDADAPPPEVFNVWIEITPRGEAGLGDERRMLTGALEGATIDGLSVRDLREIDNTPRRLAIRLRLRDEAGRSGTPAA